jgi:A/G-specific adenine glycosylase
VSEIMLQQTRVETVLPYYERFLERFPDVETLAAAPLESVLALWSGLGYYRRARSLHAGARALAERHGGVFPRHLEAALEIPGVGPYTAGAVLSIAYNLAVPVVDGNVERVLTRLFRLPGDPRRAQNARRLREIALCHLPPGQASEYSQALMELGALVCTPARPRCGECPLAQICQARAAGDVERYPELPARRAPVAVRLQAAIVQRAGRYLLEEVTGRPYLQGMWLFPFVEAASRGARAPVRPAGALIERVEALTGGRVAGVRFAGRVQHAVTFRRITVEAFHLRLESIVPRREARTGCRWARHEELGRTVPVSSIVLKLAAKGLSG